MKNGKDRRKFKRNHLICYLPVFNRRTNSQIGNIIDISLGGIMVIDNSQKKPEKIYELEIDVSDELDETDSIIFSAKCIWTKEDIKPDRFISGFKMEPDQPEAKHKIQHLMEELAISQFGFEDE